MAEHIVISRTDGIGDLVLTLPMLGVLKSERPDCRITILGRSYTAPIAEACQFTDGFANWDEVSGESPEAQAAFIKSLEAAIFIHVFPRKEVVQAAYTAGCKVRVATARRFHTFARVNRRLWFSRKKSDEHEAMLNLRMLQAIGIEAELSDEAVIANYGLLRKATLPDVAKTFCSQERTILLHPLSHGSAPAWPLSAYSSLIQKLKKAGFSVGITGTADEREQMGDGLPWADVTDFCGAVSLAELITLISHSQGMVAASTGPLHIAAALGRFALGLYSPQRPIFATRWRPIGENAHFIEAHSHSDDGILDIPPVLVAQKIITAYTR